MFFEDLMMRRNVDAIYNVVAYLGAKLKLNTIFSRVHAITQ